MKRSAKETKIDPGEQPRYLGYQWGEPLAGERFFRVNRNAEELEITAAMPAYLSGDHPCDLIRQYEIAPRNRPDDKKRMGKGSPHVRFANAKGDDELIDFVRNFGPVLCTNWQIFDPEESLGPRGLNGVSAAPMLMRARQDLRELRNERRIYHAALRLSVELGREPGEYDVDKARKWMAETANGIRAWPKQWRREKKEREREQQARQDPLWRVRKDSIGRIASVAESGPATLLPPELDARIVLCELVNMFPGLAFPNPSEMHSYIRFGIRPLLYSLLRREFLYPRGVKVCAYIRCRNLFQVERSGQQFCDDLCSRRERQRQYWQNHGKAAREARLTRSKNRKP